MLNGLCQDKTLLEWLNQYVFKEEASLCFNSINSGSASASSDYAHKVYENVVKSTVNAGTTTASYFGTISADSCQILVDKAIHWQQRAFVGKVCMTRNSPDFYVEKSVSDSIGSTRQFIVDTYIKSKSGRKLVQPIITPRFVPTCDLDLLTGLGDIVKEFGGDDEMGFDAIRTHTHLSETLAEVEWVRELEPSFENYTEIYDKCGLLYEGSMMAHAIHLSDDEIKLITDRGASIVHCPNSNCSLRSGILDIVNTIERSALKHAYLNRKAIKMTTADKSSSVDKCPTSPVTAVQRSSRIKIGLGTDCSAGYTPSMLDAMRFAISTSKTASTLNQQGKSRPLFMNHVDALHLATQGSAQALTMDMKIGRFDVNFKFDALRIKADRFGTMAFDCGVHSIDTMFQRFIYLGDDRNIKQVWIDGQKVKDMLS